jgi:NAD(P)-dependent dehydrogenase (short-subunit alcohol dehydrogenase family)
MMKNKKVLITGGANGIGLAITKAFVKQEAVVFVVDKDMVKGKELESQFPAVKFFCVDIVNEKAILAVFEELRSMGISLDVLVNNAGLSHFMALEACETSMWDEVINVNLRAPFIFSREFVRMHPKNSYGRIINIASTRYVLSEPGGEAYGASKGGIVSLTHALANSLSDSGITVNCIAPGWIHKDNYDELKDEDHRQHLSGRVGKPEDVAEIGLFLCQPGNDFINGEEIRVDGGMTRKMIYKD